MKRTFRLCLSAAILLMAALATASCTDAVAPLTDDPTDVPATTPDEDLTGKPIRIGSVISLPATTGADTEASGEAGTQGSAETRIIPPDSNFPKEGSTMTVFCFVPTNASNGEEVSPAAHANYTYNGTSWQPTNPDAPLCWQHSTQRHFFAAVSPAVDDTEVEFGAKAKGLGENTAIDEEGNEYICTMIFDPAFNLPTEWTDERYTAWGRVRSTAIGGACVYGEAPKADAQISLTLCRPLVRINIISESAQVTLRNAPAATSSTASLSDPVTLTMRMLSGGEWVHNAYTLPYSNSDIEGTTDISFTTDTEVSKSTVANKGLTAGGRVKIIKKGNNMSIVTNSTAGGLADALANAGTSKKKIVIEGTINDADISALKDFITSNKITDVAIVAEGMTSIGNRAFYQCTSLTSISLPDGVTSIGKDAFNNCTSLKSINLPDGVTNIGDNAFFACRSLESISLPDGVTSIENSTFSGCKVLTSISLPDGITSIGKDAFKNCTSLKSINLPDGVTNIGDNAFSACSSLESISLPDGVTSIENFTFSGCKVLTNISLPDGITSIGGDAFNNCTSLKSISLPDRVTSIESNAFYYCTSLTSINLPDGVTSIEVAVFSNCTSLKSISLPDRVTSIGEQAFSQCTSLESISLPDGVTSIGKQAFRQCTSLTSISLPDRVASIGEQAFRQCTFLTSISLPDGVTSIERSTFKDCASLKSISLPDGVTSIEEDAFYDCTSLEEISLSGINDQYEFALPKLGNDAFTNTPLNTLYLRDVPEAIFKDNQSTYSTWGDISWKAILYDYNDIGSDLDGANYKGNWVPNP